MSHIEPVMRDAIQSAVEMVMAAGSLAPRYFHAHPSIAHGMLLAACSLGLVAVIDRACPPGRWYVVRDPLIGRDGEDYEALTRDALVVGISTRTDREDRLRALGFAALTSDERRQQLAMSMALKDWPK